jgi:O-antigen ligase
MKAAAFKYTVLSWLSLLSMLILLLLPFQALLTVWVASNFGHYIAVRLWKEVLLAICVLGVLYLLATDHKIRSHTLTRRLVWLILGYAVLNIVWGLLALNQHDVTAKAMGYGLLIDLRFLAFFLVTWAVALRLGRLRTHWEWLTLWPAMGVVIFGLLQILVLPHDALRHFGYGPATIPAIETINHNQQYYRIAATLRGANPLGAYLIIPISLLTVLLARPGRNWRQVVCLIATLPVLLFSFSRSAWAGAVVSVAIVLALAIGSPKMRRLSLLIAAVLVVLAAGLAFGLRNNTRFQNFALHTQTNSAVKTTSNGGHSTAIRAGLHDLRHDPLGQGPGTAGPASIYNNQPPRIAENYFIQIGQETGLLGLLLFALINIGVGALLWVRRTDPLALSLFASLIGLTLVNMLSHAWADDTLAYIWWGLAGIAMVQLPQPKPKRDETIS